MAAEHFQRELAVAAKLARQVGGMDDDRRADALHDHHHAHQRHLGKIWSDINREMPVHVPSRAYLLEAERLTRAKGRIEVPIGRVAELGRDVVALLDAGADDTLFELGKRIATARLDAQSRALVARLGPMDWAREPAPVTGDALDAVIADFEKAITADTALNEFGLRPRMQMQFLGGDPPRTLEDTSSFLYNQLFATLARDPWLGMATPGMFTGLQDDGIRVNIESR